MTTYAGPERVRCPDCGTMHRSGERHGCAERPQVPHYRRGSIEPIDFVRSQGLSFCEGNIVKYVTRWRHKGGLVDLLKARDYLNWLIEDAQAAEPQTAALDRYEPPAEPPRLVPRMEGAEGGTFISAPPGVPTLGDDALPATVRERLRQDMNERY